MLLPARSATALQARRIALQAGGRGYPDYPPEADPPLAGNSHALNYSGHFRSSVYNAILQN